MFLYYYITRLLGYYVTMLLCSYITILLYYCIAVLLYHYITISLYYYTTLNYSITLSLYHSHSIPLLLLLFLPLLVLLIRFKYPIGKVYPIKIFLALFFVSFKVWNALNTFTRAQNGDQGDTSFLIPCRKVSPNTFTIIYQPQDLWPQLFCGCSLRRQPY